MRIAVRIAKGGWRSEDCEVGIVKWEMWSEGWEVKNVKVYGSFKNRIILNLLIKYTHLLPVFLADRWLLSLQCRLAWEKMRRSCDWAFLACRPLQSVNPNQSLTYHSWAYHISWFQHLQSKIRKCKCLSFFFTPFPNSDFYSTPSWPLAPEHVESEELRQSVACLSCMHLVIPSSSPLMMAMIMCSACVPILLRRTSSTVLVCPSSSDED